MYIIFIPYTVKTQIYLASSLATWIMYFSLGCIDINERKRLDILAILSQVISYFLLKISWERSNYTYTYSRRTKQKYVIYVYMYNNTQNLEILSTYFITNNLYLEYIEKLRTYNVGCVHWKNEWNVLYINLHLLQQWTLNRGKHSFFFLKTSSKIDRVY